VQDEVVATVTQNHILNDLINNTIQALPQLSGIGVKFIVRPDLFPTKEVDRDAEFQNLKTKIPALKLLDSAFGLQLANSSQP